MANAFLCSIEEKLEHSTRTSCQTSWRQVDNTLATMRDVPSAGSFLSTHFIYFFLQSAHHPSSVSPWNGDTSERLQDGKKCLLETSKYWPISPSPKPCCQLTDTMFTNLRYHDTLINCTISISLRCLSDVSRPRMSNKIDHTLQPVFRSPQIGEVLKVR